MKLELELEQEADGRWLAEFTRFPGVAAYGPSKEEAIRNAAKVLIESEHAPPTPDKREAPGLVDSCPTCGSIFANYDPSEKCRDSWHSSAGTPKGTK